jgi:hypothetical protein
MKCPHCGIACHESWDYKQISPEEEPIGEIKGSLGEFRGVSGTGYEFRGQATKPRNSRNAGCPVFPYHRSRIMGRTD